MIKFKKNREDAIIPRKSKKGDSGFDLFTLDDCIIDKHETIVIPTGISVQLEQNQEASVRPRSGITLKGLEGATYTSIDFIKGEDNECYCAKIEHNCSPYIRVILGTLDSNYRGDVGIIVYNQEDYKVKIPAKTKLAQMVVSLISTDEVIIVDELDKSERGNNGFGSSGV
ncbi:TPA: deoxyuridine 5'-triphosphate nucleotidohydrolase [Clostridium botulinum]|nr:deoxyuridine 5'-triphosphate nucleotidohydrolase [Clostridium botulinum]HBJ1652745.1 deoxyuridine 5'-triphosphate nucleotidohydrolase [Clostridium botulinum]